MRIGHGFDAHAFGRGSGLRLGGVDVPFDRGVVAHSDGDVILHALCDALLGAAALGDLGRHFPSADPRWRGADSRDMLRRVAQLVAQRGFAVCNVDLSVICQAPRLAEYTDAMRRCIAGDLETEPDRVSVKATTTDGLGFTGRGEGIAAHAVVIIAATD